MGWVAFGHSPQRREYSTNATGTKGLSVPTHNGQSADADARLVKHNDTSLRQRLLYRRQVG